MFFISVWNEFYTFYNVVISIPQVHRSHDHIGDTGKLVFLIS